MLEIKLNGTHQLLVYADEVNILGGSVHTVKENAETLLVVSEETGKEINADKKSLRGHISGSEYNTNSG